MSARPSRPRVLAIAGSDPSGGAGIQADLKSIAAFGGYGMAAITALTAQNTRAVDGVHAPPAEFVADQLRAVSDDIAVDAVKIGMLFSAPIVEVVAEWVRRTRPAVVVLDERAPTAGRCRRAGGARAGTCGAPHHAQPR